MNFYRRREFVRLAGMAGAWLQQPQGFRQDAGQRPPNIIFIMADDLGYGDLGCYGQTKIRTPHIDALAAEGLRFTDAYSGCTVCAPSRSVLMTGLHMGHTSVRCNPGGVPLLPGDVTVGEVLKRARYATGCFGKWALGPIGTAGVPWKHGFDEFFGYLHQVHAHSYYPEFLYTNDREYPLKGNTEGKRITYSHDVIANRTLDFIRRRRKEPFFCYVPFTIPHRELLVPEDSLAEYKGRFPEDVPVAERQYYGDQPAPRATLAAMITRMDRDVGRIVVLLKELNLDRDTLLFFTSDNGSPEPAHGNEFFASNGPLRGHKRNFYEGGIRIPAIARWPGRIRAGTVSRMPWYFCDVLPTVAELARLRPPNGLDGISIVPELLGAKAAGREQARHQFMYWELPVFESGRFREEIPRQAVRMGQWKAVRPEPGGRLELYNLEDDIGETRDLAAERPRVMARIEEYLRTARTEPRPQELHKWPDRQQVVVGGACERPSL
jgi:arylsulfatase A-like enzyme